MLVYIIVNLLIASNTILCIINNGTTIKGSAIIHSLAYSRGIQLVLSFE